MPTCSNETIHGVEMHELPDLAALGTQAPLVIDCSSHIVSRPIDWSRVGVAYAGAQKNIGPAGLTLVIVREDLIGHALPITPSAFDYQIVADNGSMYNTPPTYPWYLAGLVFQWIQRQREGELTGLAAIEARNVAKAKLFYDYVDASGFYVNKVAGNCRSRMNIPFFLPSEPARPPGAGGGRGQEARRLAGVPPRTRGAGHRWPEGPQPRPAEADSVAPIWREIMSACRALEAPTRVAYLGPAGTFSEEAALGYFGSSIDARACAQLRRGVPRHQCGRPTSAWCRSRTPPKAWWRARWTCCLHTPLFIVGETSLLRAPQPAAQEPSLAGIQVVSPTRRRWRSATTG
jgi:hypothetical protein